MRHPRAHSHPCSMAEVGCTHRVPCDGEEVENYDGAPAVTCLAYHLYGGGIAEVMCHACRASTCPDCGSVTRLEPHATRCSRRAVEARA